MTKKALHVFDGVPIPVDYVSTQTYALLAKRDGGKTYTTLLFEEQLCDAGLFFVTLDPVGKHWALRAGADGSPDGGKPGVWVLGGLHADVPLEPTSGALIADVVVDHPGQYVLDVSTFDTDADQDRFALAFAQRLFRRKAKDPGFPLTLILEEAEAFIPERYSTGQAKMLGAFGRIMRQGRNHGLGMWMVAQRAQALNKGVLSQAEVLIVKQMAHPRDLDAVEAWVKANGTPEERKEMMSSVAALEQNEAYVWSPAWLRVFKRARVPARATFDSSASVKGGEAAQQVDLVPLDVDALGRSIAQTAERAKAEDPKELRRMISDLRRELAQRPTEKQIETVTETVEVPVLANGSVERLQESVAAIADVGEKLTAISTEIRTELQRIARQPAPPPTAAVEWRPPSAPLSPTPRRPAVAAPPSAPVDGDFRLGKAHRAILAVLDQRRGLVTSKRHLAVATGYSIGGGGFNNPLGALRSAGLIEGSDPIAITDTGIEAIAGQYEPLPTGQALLEHWSRLGKAHSLILHQLAAVYPDSMSKQDLADATGYEASGGGFNNPLGKLRTLELIEGRNELRLTDALGAEVVGVAA